mmetsp:Transcript_38324/g.120176  ORF Transcript_38324/g.120176 Transcript_38324/m.120176 type:complete len:238 (+) Transcript_38324:148-861(+)
MSLSTRPRASALVGFAKPSVPMATAAVVVSSGTLRWLPPSRSSAVTASSRRCGKVRGTVPTAVGCPTSGSSRSRRNSCRSKRSRVLKSGSTTLRSPRLSARIFSRASPMRLGSCRFCAFRKTLKRSRSAPAAAFCTASVRQPTLMTRPATPASVYAGRDMILTSMGNVFEALDQASPSCSRSAATSSRRWGTRATPTLGSECSSSTSSAPAHSRTLSSFSPNCFTRAPKRRATISSS